MAGQVSRRLIVQTPEHSTMTEDYFILDLCRDRFYRYDLPEFIRSTRLASSLADGLILQAQDSYMLRKNRRAIDLIASLQ